MRRLTLRELKEQYGGILPPDATLRPDDDEIAATAAARPAPAAKPKRRSGRGERFAVLNAFVDFGIADADLTPAEALVWLVLFRDAKAVTGTARTGQTDIARRAGLSVRGVKLALRNLKRKGMVRVIHRGQLNGGPSIYAIHPTGSHGVTQFPLHGAKTRTQLGYSVTPIPEWDQYAARHCRSGGVSESASASASESKSESE